MASIHKTDDGTYRVRWRDPSGKQQSRNFRTRREASNFVAEIRVAVNRGAYIDPRAGRQKFGPYALRWLESRNDEKTTAARDASVMTNHVLARWADVPIMAIEHTSVQAWVTELSEHKGLSPATVTECFRLTNNVLKAAGRDRLIGFNPCDGVKLPRRRKKAGDDQVIALSDFRDRLLPVVPDRYRALVGTAGGTGLRWGEIAGLRWDAVDLDAGRLWVIRVAVEVSGHVSAKPYPKTRAGRRVVPIAPFAVELLRKQLATYDPDELGHVFTNEVGGPLWRGHFRARVWRPALVRAGLLGSVRQLSERAWLASGVDASDTEWTGTFRSEERAVSEVVRRHHGGLRFHDVRHSYATWLVSAGVPVNDVARIMGHENTSTTLDRYTHSTDDRYARVLAAFVPDLFPQGRDDAN